MSVVSFILWGGTILGVVLAGIGMALGWNGRGQPPGSVKVDDYLTEPGKVPTRYWKRYQGGLYEAPVPGQSDKVRIIAMFGPFGWRREHRIVDKDEIVYLDDRRQFVAYGRSQLQARGLLEFQQYRKQLEELVVMNNALQFGYDELQRKVEDITGQRVETAVDAIERMKPAMRSGGQR